MNTIYKYVQHLGKFSRTIFRRLFIISNWNCKWSAYEKTYSLEWKNCNKKLRCNEIRWIEMIDGWPRSFLSYILLFDLLSTLIENLYLQKLKIGKLLRTWHFVQKIKLSQRTWQLASINGGPVHFGQWKFHVRTQSKIL